MEGVCKKFLYCCTHLHVKYIEWVQETCVYFAIYKHYWRGTDDCRYQILHTITSPVPILDLFTITQSSGGTCAWNKAGTVKVLDKCTALITWYCRMDKSTLVIKSRPLVPGFLRLCHKHSDHDYTTSTWVPVACL